MLGIKNSGDFKNIEKFLDFANDMRVHQILNKYGKIGVGILSDMTPKDSGKTAGSWYYDIATDLNGAKIIWKNNNIVHGVNIAVILQYGHGTGTGGYVRGRDYINPAIEKVMQDLAESAWKEVVKL